MNNEFIIDGPIIPLPHGISLRDWLAGMALQGLTGSPSWEELSQIDPAIWLKAITIHSYKVADHMLDARELSPEELNES